MGSHQLKKIIVGSKNSAIDIKTGCDFPKKAWEMAYNTIMLYMNSLCYIIVVLKHTVAALRVLNEL